MARLTPRSSAIGRFLRFQRRLPYASFHSSPIQRLDHNLALEIGLFLYEVHHEHHIKLRLACMALVLLVFASPLRAETEKRIAFVVGNAAYQAAPLATTANDAGLVAQTLQGRASMSPGRATSMANPCARHSGIFSKRRRHRDQTPWCSCISPVTVCSSMAKTISRRSMRRSYPHRTWRSKRCASRLCKAARRASAQGELYCPRRSAGPAFRDVGTALAGGLAHTVAEPNTLVAFNAAPGTVAATEQGPYGAYARALTEMIWDGGLPPSDLFEAVRLRVNEETKGRVFPGTHQGSRRPSSFLSRRRTRHPHHLRRTVSTRSARVL